MMRIEWSGIFWLAVLAMCCGLLWFFGYKSTVLAPRFVSEVSYVRTGMPLIAQASTSMSDRAVATTSTSTIHVISATHVERPSEVKAVYMSSWVAGTPAIREKMVSLIDRTEVNAVVIDVKDNSGLLSWDGRVTDLNAFIEKLHTKNIYVIGRVASFQDPAYVAKHPELAVKNKKNGQVWRDHKGVPWVDTGSKEMWKYLVDVGREAHARGFDEINYDYIRFPTDGDLKNMTFPLSGDRGKTHKREIVREFFAYLHDELSVKGIPISGDIFGIVLTSPTERDTLGQDLRDALVYFDFVAPMVYPSHYYAGTAGYSNPADHPGEIIAYSMRAARAIIDSMVNDCVIDRPVMTPNCATLAALQTKNNLPRAATTSTSTVKASTSIGEVLDDEVLPAPVVATYLPGEKELYATFTEEQLLKKLRPWYQDFNMGADYTAAMVRAQIDEGNKLGVTSWMLWDPANTYTEGALKNSP